MNERFAIVHATTKHVDEIAPLFDEYRCWYGEESNPDAARRFLSERLAASESEVFFVCSENRPIAFVQLYPLYSSIDLEPIWILNDLYVIEAARRQGTATLLLDVAAEFAKGTGATRLELVTQSANEVAKALYESLGWVQDNQFIQYTLKTAGSETLMIGEETPDTH